MQQTANNKKLESAVSRTKFKFLSTFFFAIFILTSTGCNLSQIKEQLKLPKLPEFLIISGKKKDNSATENTAKTDKKSEEVSTLENEEDAKNQSQVNRLFAQIYIQEVQLSPMALTREGRSLNKDQWDDFSDKGAFAKLRFAQENLSTLKARTAEIKSLTEQQKIDQAIIEYHLKNTVSIHPYRYYQYPVTPFSGLHIELPEFLINDHSIKDIHDANAYISRLEKLPLAMDQLISNIKRSEQNGVLLPKELYPSVISICKKIITGYPLSSNNTENVLFSDFKKKVNRLDLYDESKSALEKRAHTVLIKKVKPGYERLIAFLKQQSTRAPVKYGLAHLPKGRHYYQTLLNRYSSTDLGFEHYHEIGMKEVASLQKSLASFAPKLGYSGDAAGFWNYYRQQQHPTYQNSPEGRNAFINDARSKILLAEEKLGKYFSFIPDTTLKVKPVENFRESISPVAFYSSGYSTIENSASFYINLSNIDKLNRHDLPALIFKETLPGHHLQSSRNQTIQNQSKFRQTHQHSAFKNGWALYASTLADDMKLYQTPLEQFSHLLIQLEYAAMLVVDTGIHGFGWGKDMAVNYLQKNTPFSLQRSIQLVQKTASLPGESSSTMIGFKTIRDLKEKTKSQLRFQFKEKNFHDLMLNQGSLPLPLLSRAVENQLKSFNSF